MMDIFREFTFEAAHYLPSVPENHKCGRVHGHSYHVTVTVTGPVDPTAGWVVDFGDIKQAFGPIEAAVDHQLLNNLISNPTSENLASWIFGQLRASIPVSAVTVRETATSGATYRPPPA